MTTINKHLTFFLGGCRKSSGKFPQSSQYLVILFRQNRLGLRTNLRISGMIRSCRFWYSVTYYVESTYNREVEPPENNRISPSSAVNHLFLDPGLAESPTSIKLTN